ncbi:MAG: helix-turn-helix domain-containing protein [Myxococcales bacterium]|nr:helix-turn-helix domain-containing protein [Myxococcales bacterium]
MQVDRHSLARELIRALRGDRSQVQLSRRLGFSTNAVYSWESGRRWPSASRFFFVAQRVGIDVVDALGRFYPTPPDWLQQEPATPSWVLSFLQELRGTVPIGVLAERMGRSRFTVSRWLSGRSEPRLPDLLALVDVASLRLLDFVSCFVPPDSLPTTRRAWRRLQAARELAWGSPWAQVVLLGLELADYAALPAHDDAWLAQRLDLPEEEVSEALRRLRAAGQIRRVGSHLRPAEILSVDLRRAGAIALKRHWTEVAARRLQHDDTMASYNVFTVSEPVLEQIRELQRAHYRAVRALVGSAPRADRVVLMNLQLVALDRP